MVVGAFPCETETTPVGTAFEATEETGLEFATATGVDTVVKTGVAATELVGVFPTWDTDDNTLLEATGTASVGKIVGVPAVG